MSIRHGKSKTINKECAIDLNFCAKPEQYEYDSFVVQITSVDKHNEFYTTHVNKGVFTVRSKEDGDFF